MLVFFSLLLQTALSQTCGWTEASVDADGVATPASCSHTALAASPSESCSESWYACAAATTQDACGQASAEDGSTMYCTWLPVPSGLFAEHNSGGQCVPNEFNTCDLLDCFQDQILPSLVCAAFETSNDCSNDAVYGATIDVNSIEALPSAYEFGYFDWDECYVLETNEETGVVTRMQDAILGGDLRNEEPGSAFVYCDEMQDDLNDNNHPCAASQIIANAVCRGEQSCQDITLKGSTWCWGENSCNEAVFKPQESTHVVHCTGQESCRDARGYERNTVEEADALNTVYFCDGDSGNGRTCEGSLLQDNAVCSDDEACKEAAISAKTVTCTQGDQPCRETEIITDYLTCDVDQGCKYVDATIETEMLCSVEGACEDADVTLSTEASLLCSDFLACDGITVNYKVGVFEGNNSLICGAGQACQDAEIRVEAICAVNESCSGANIYADVMCVDGASCEDTFISQGTVCCGPGCVFANTRPDPNDNEATEGIGCVEGDLDPHEEYGACVRCGTETLLGWATANKTNMGIAIAIAVILLLIALVILFTIFKKLGIIGGGSTEVVEGDE